MSELADRMRRQLASKSTETPRPLAPPQAYPWRITLDLTAEDHQALKLAAAQHDTTMADLLRGLVVLPAPDSSEHSRARALLNAGLILPVLDGLNEIPGCGAQPGHRLA